MVEGVRHNERIIVGAYVDGEGGVCPMLAAHRCGGRTDFLSFAKSWDRFTGAGKRARRATKCELRVLMSHLEASLMEDAGLDLDCAIEEHRAILDRRDREARDPLGEIVVRRLYKASPGRINMISGTMHAGEVLSR
jgi:hypothetical protein